MQVFFRALHVWSHVLYGTNALHPVFPTAARSARDPHSEHAGRARAESRRGQSPRFAESSQSLTSFVPGKITFTWEEL